VALFGGEAERAAALGRFVHVYVDRETRRPVAELPMALAEALDQLKAAA
jgi:acyl-CoA thioester hydrolase